MWAKLYRQVATITSKEPNRGPTKIGELVNADDIIAHIETSMGLTGESDALIVVDRYSKYLDCDPPAEEKHTGITQILPRRNRPKVRMLRLGAGP